MTDGRGGSAAGSHAGERGPDATRSARYTNPGQQEITPPVDCEIWPRWMSGFSTTYDFGGNTLASCQGGGDIKMLRLGRPTFPRTPPACLFNSPVLCIVVAMWYGDVCSSNTETLEGENHPERHY